jgi:hypothetical protein
VLVVIWEPYRCRRRRRSGRKRGGGEGDEEEEVAGPGSLHATAKHHTCRRNAVRACI